MKLKIGIFIILSLLIGAGVSYAAIYNPVISSTIVSGNCTSMDEASHCILLKGTSGGIVEVPYSDWDEVHLGGTYLYVFYDHLYGKDEVFFGKLTRHYGGI